jgi:hypothetical protein
MLPLAAAVINKKGDPAFYGKVSLIVFPAGFPVQESQLIGKGFELQATLTAACS